MLPSILYNFLHHDLIYETERSAWLSYGKKKMKLITSKVFQKMISDQIIYVNLIAYVDVISDPTWGRNMYLQPCTDTENCQS